VVLEGRLTAASLLSEPLSAVLVALPSLPCLPSCVLRSGLAEAYPSPLTDSLGAATALLLPPLLLLLGVYISILLPSKFALLGLVVLFTL